MPTRQEAVCLLLAQAACSQLLPVAVLVDFSIVPLVPKRRRFGDPKRFGTPLRFNFNCFHSFCSIRPELTRLSSSKIHPEFDDPRTTTFMFISGASVSANTSTRLSTALIDLYSYNSIDRASTFEGSISFASLPLQPIPKNSSVHSGPIYTGFMSGPIERTLLSSPLDRGIFSGPSSKSLLINGRDFYSDQTEFHSPAEWY